MSLMPLIVLAVVAMICLVALRLARVHLGRSPLPDGHGRRLFLLGFVVVPPMVFGALVPSDSIPVLAIYVAILASLVSVMWVVAQIAAHALPGPRGQLVRLALTGRQVQPEDEPFDPPITAPLAATVASVDRASAAFARGEAFPGQIHAAGFRDSWERLDEATLTLERGIADDQRLGRGAASSARATAADARGRLNTLRGLAIEDGQTWAMA
jgi:hypothetical protein